MEVGEGDQGPVEAPWGGGRGLRFRGGLGDFGGRFGLGGGGVRRGRFGTEEEER